MLGTFAVDAAASPVLAAPPAAGVAPDEPDGAAPEPDGAGFDVASAAPSASILFRSKVEIVRMRLLPSSPMSTRMNEDSILTTVPSTTTSRPLRR